VVNNTTDIKDTRILSEEYSLAQNYPNPFNPSTIISYSIPQSDFVTLKVYDVLGNEIRTIINEYQQAGEYKINFNAGKIASGIYIYCLKASNNFVQTKKMLLVR
jgi:hypothetical protein